MNCKNYDTKNESDDILKDMHLRENPYEVPEGYFDKMESEVRDKIRKEERLEEDTEDMSGQPVLKGLLRPALGLVFSFLIVFAFAYGIFALTGTLKWKKNAASKATESGYVSSETDAIREINLYDYAQYVSENPSTIDDTVSSEDIINYLTESNTPIAMLADIEH